MIAGPLGAFLQTRRLEAPLQLAEVSAVLIFRYDALGDAVLTTPVWRVLKKASPTIRIGVVGSPRNLAFLKSDPDIDDVFPVPRSASWKSIANILRMRRTQWDVVINVSLSDKTWGAVLARLVAPKAYRVTIAREKLDRYEKLYSRVGLRPPLHPPTPFGVQNLIALQTAVQVSVTDTDSRPSVHVDGRISAELRHRIDVILTTHGRSRFAILNTDAAQSFREWGFQNNLTFATALEQSHTEYLVLWTSAPSRAAERQRSLAEVGLSDRYLATPSVQHLAAAIAESSLVISPDTSIIHFASALNRPIIGLYHEHSEFSPHSEDAVVLTPKVGQFVSSIDPTDALEAARTLLAVTQSRSAKE